MAAERAGATVFLVPADNMEELDGVDTGDMRLISVSTFQEALDALESSAARRSSRRLPILTHPRGVTERHALGWAAAADALRWGGNEHRHDAP